MAGNHGFAFILFAVSVTWAALVTASGPVFADERQTIGFLEEVRIFPGDIHFKAKVDTGARTSSIDVRDPEIFERDGREWVRFSVTNKDNQAVAVERPVVRKSAVRRAGTAAQERFVVRLGICVGSFFKIAEVNLNDRAGMSFKMLLGRLYLGDKFIIDASKKYLTKPSCQEPDV